jgi:hypothetical protein
MPIPRFIRCGKCHVVMGLRHYFLKHRRANGVKCSPVQCVICKRPVGNEGMTAWGGPVCSEECEGVYPELPEEKRKYPDVWGPIDAIEQAKNLPLIYQRRRAS